MKSDNTTTYCTAKMRVLLLLFPFLLLCCYASTQAQEGMKDHEELKRMYQEDQSDRMTGEIDWAVVSKRDSLREARVYELLDSGKVRTGQDYYHAAMIFQHGGDTVASGMAVKMARQAVALDSAVNRWLLAAAIDRDLMRRNEPQIYGTQYIKTTADGPWELYTIDTTKISDEERKAYRVETLAEQRERVKMMNKKKLSEMLAEGRGVEEIVRYCQQHDKDEAAYDISEGGINSFGYQLMAENRLEDALKVFEANTELYPNAFNTHDSLGECLLKLGRTEEAVVAYRKSLELNPKNTHAREVIEELDVKG